MLRKNKKTLTETIRTIFDFYLTLKKVCLRKFGPFFETDVDNNTINRLDNSGSNEIMQKVVASIV